jgi:peptide-methionine (S)-S-oxide reductase
MFQRRVKPRIATWLRTLPVVAAVGVIAMFGLRAGASSADEAHVVPAPAVDEAAGAATSEVAVLAGGCFWGVQGVFQHVTGVSRGSTGHAESVQVTFDPHKISYGHILQIYFSVAHDPTELNRQGPDTGTQYRSAIFPTSADQARVAKAYIAQLNQAHVFDAAIVTKIEADKAFYPAEAYHQDFLVQHPTYPYIVINDQPKIANLKRLLPELYRPDPVLVAAVTN